jgi:hypothetical protein
MNYFVEFSAYVDERKRPENFPRVIHIQENYNNVESMTHLRDIVNQRFISLVTSAGLIAMKDENKPVETKLTFDQRMFVPWHMITHMHVDTHLIQEEPQTPQDPLIPVSSEPVEKKEPTVH